MQLASPVQLSLKQLLIWLNSSLTAIILSIHPVNDPLTNKNYRSSVPPDQEQRSVHIPNCWYLSSIHRIELLTGTYIVVTEHYVLLSLRSVLRRTKGVDLEVNATAPVLKFPIMNSNELSETYITHLTVTSHHPRPFLAPRRC